MAPVVRNLWSVYTVAVKEIYQKPATMFIINFIVYTVLDYLIQLFLDLGFGIELPKYHSYLTFMNGEAYLGDGGSICTSWLCIFLLLCSALEQSLHEIKEMDENFDLYPSDNSFYI